MAKGGVEQESRKARARRRARGRSIFGILLIGFVLVASLIIWRRSYGIAISGDIVALNRQREQLEGEEARLRSLIHDESSRARLGETVERLGMRIPSDKQVRIISRPSQHETP